MSRSKRSAASEVRAAGSRTNCSLCTAPPSLPPAPSPPPPPPPTSQEPPRPSSRTRPTAVRGESPSHLQRRRKRIGGACETKETPPTTAAPPPPPRRPASHNRRGRGAPPRGAGRAGASSSLLGLVLLFCVSPLERVRDGEGNKERRKTVSRVSSTSGRLFFLFSFFFFFSTLSALSGSLLSFTLCSLPLSFKAPISPPPPRGALTLRNKMRSAIALGRVAAMPSCSRRATSSAPAPARRVVAVKVKIEAA